MCELYGTYEFKEKHCFGIEIEVERGKQEYRQSAPVGWNVTADGSLQNGVEFVSNVLPLEHVDDALSRIQQHLSAGKFEASFRCGVHVHYNAGNMTPQQLYNLVKFYISFENVLFALHPMRCENMFCVPLQNAAEYISQVKKYPQTNIHSALVGYSKKYMALNLVPAGALGSIEFRHMIGTVDTNEIRKWIHVILRLVELAEEYKFEDFIKQVTTESEYHMWLTRVLGEGDYPEEYIRYLRRGIRYGKTFN
jgi:hypothetical protein